MFNSSRDFVTRLAFVALAGTAGLIAGTCKDIQGQIQETALPPSACASAIGLCTQSKISGNIKGDAQFTGTAALTSPDSGLTGVIFIAGDVVANIEFDGKSGTLTIKSAAAYRTVGSGDLVDNQTIIGGTGAFAAATGSLRISGTFSGGAGTSRFEGTLCY